MNSRPREILASGRCRTTWFVAALSALAIGAAGASVAGAVETVPTAGTAATSPTAAAVPALPQRSLGARVLRPGARGTDVRELQQILRRRGHRIAADGAYGPKTTRAIKRVQLLNKLIVSGNCDWATMRKLGVRRIRSGVTPVTPTPATPVPSTVNYPLAGPNATAAKYLKVFPVGGKHTYSDDWGAPRGQGSHQGNDIMAADGTPLRAVTNGVVTRANRVESGLGGIYVWLRDSAGNDYYYAHMSTIAPEIQVGTRVTAGQLLGGVGNTGDARYGAAHLHFEIRPGGGSPINPFTELLAVDPEPPIRK